MNMAVNSMNAAVIDLDPPTWQNNFPFASTQYSISDDDTLIAVAADDGIVKLIRTSDSKVLVTRRVMESSSAMSAIKLQFVKGAKRLEHTANILVILIHSICDSSVDVQSEISNEENLTPVPALDATFLSDDPRACPSSSDTITFFGTLIIVSGIDGQALGSSDKNVASRAGMDIKVSRCNIPRRALKETVLSLDACFLNKDLARLFVCCQKNIVLAFDYDVCSNQVSIEPKVMDLSSSDVEVEIKHYNHSKENACDYHFCSFEISIYHPFTLFTVAAQMGDEWIITWCDILSLTVSGSYHIQKIDGVKSLGVISCMSILAINDNSIAAVVALKDPHGISLEVVQAILKPTATTSIDSPYHCDRNRSLAVTDFHPVFKIKLSTNLYMHESTSGTNNSIDGTCGPLDRSGDEVICFNLKRSTVNDPFCFQYYFMRNEIPSFKAFFPGSDIVIGKFRFLLATKSFDDAETLVASTGSLLSPFGSMHSSEVALFHFKALLEDDDSLSRESMERAKLLLRRLAHGAVSGGHSGVQSLISASLALYHWPDEKPQRFKSFSPPKLLQKSSEISPNSQSHDSSNRFDPSVLESSVSLDPSTVIYRKALTAMSLTFQNALSGVSRSYVSQLEDHKRMIDARIIALKCLEKFPELLVDCEDFSWIKSRHLSRLVNVPKSAKEIFGALVARGSISDALRLKDFECCRDLINVETMVETILLIHSAVDPKLYIDWVRDVMLQLQVTDTMVFLILKWALQMAHSFDEENFHGIDASILLLSTVKNALISLFGNIHKAFVNTRTATTDSSRIVQVAADPTVMRVNFMRGYGEKKTDSLVSMRIRYRTFDKDDVEDEDHYSLIAMKLYMAKALKEARVLGLSGEQLRLNQLQGSNCTIKIARNLVLHFFNNSKYESIRMDVQRFCIKYHLEYDKVIVLCVKEICDGRTKTKFKPTDIILLARTAQGSDAICDLALCMCRMTSVCDEAPEDVATFTRDAIDRAIHEDIRAELKEALRLLLIYDIIRRYAGISAKEFFNVSDVRHGSRLIDFVCTFVHSPTVLSDALTLCNAFTHLSKADACNQILQRSLLATFDRDLNALAKVSESVGTDCLQTKRRMKSVSLKPCLPSDLFREICTREAKSVPGILCQICLYIAGLLEDIKNRFIGDSTADEIIRFKCLMQSICLSASSILSVAIEESIIFDDKSVISLTNRIGVTSCGDLFRIFQRLYNLQAKFDVYLTVSDLKNQKMKIELMKNSLGSAVASLVGIQAIKAKSQGSNMNLSTNRSLHDMKSCSLLSVNHNSLSPLSLIELRSTIFKLKGLSKLLFTDSREQDFIFFYFVNDFVTTTFMKDYSDPLDVVLILHLCGFSQQSDILSAPYALMHIAISLCLNTVDYIRDRKKIENLKYRAEVVMAVRKYLGASQLMKEALLVCPTKLLPVAMHASSILNIIECILDRCDNGIGECVLPFRQELQSYFSSGLSSTSSNSCTHISSSTIPVLKPSWYADDGLLLPPYDALNCCAGFLGSTLPFATVQSFGRSPEFESVVQLLFPRGAFNLAARTVLVTSSFATRFIEPTFEDTFSYDLKSMQSAIRSIDQRLAERSIGTAGGGIISGDIDSQLAMTYLRSISLQDAFKVINTSLPSSITRRDFSRIMKLTGVGLKVCGQHSLYENTVSKNVTEWENQLYFISKARELRSKAFWLGILQQMVTDLELYGLRNTDYFFVDGKSDEENHSSIILALVAGLFVGIENPSTLHLLLNDYANTFGLDFLSIAQYVIQYVLSSSPSSKDMSKRERVVNYMMSLLSRTQRLSIIRKCMRIIEQDERSGQDYQRYNMFFSIYSGVLSDLRSIEPEASYDDLLWEIREVRRRQETLQILSSFFYDDLDRNRPSLLKFFKPIMEHKKANEPLLRKSHESDVNTVRFEGEDQNHLGSLNFLAPNADSQYNTSGSYHHAVLGNLENQDDFDPLLQIEQYLHQTRDFSSVTALSPLCVPLSVPSGFVHARSLKVKFTSDHADRNGTWVSSRLLNIKNEIEPVLSRLKPLDASILAEWCANHYPKDSHERLECLELAENLSFNAARELEQSGLNGDIVLERFKRIQRQKSALSDILSVQNILSEHIVSTPFLLTADLILTHVNRVAQSLFEGPQFMPPEIFAENLLIAGSHMVAEISFNHKMLFTLKDFRIVASAVHKACRSLEKKYSHIDLASICTKMVNTLLIQADDSVAFIDSRKSGNNIGSTKEYRPAVWTTLTASNDEAGQAFPHETEETSYFTDGLGSWKLSESRYCSELKDAANGIRVAFIMSFCESFHQRRQLDDVTNKPNERSRKGINHDKRLRFVNNGSIEIRESELVMNHARFLLKLAFETCKTPGQFKTSPDNLYEYGTDVLTFAMRHRALRAARILCPKDVLHIIMQQELSLTVENVPVETVLNKCYYGCYVAKEVEAMGLNLPTSDIISLSFMDYTSFARVLWRQYGRLDPRYRTRLLILLLELTESNESSTDTEFVMAVKHELKSFSASVT